MGKKHKLPNLIVVHPLVLLSVVDHYTRLGITGDRRVVGVLLGSISKGTVDVTNSYAVPFEEEDLHGNKFFFLDQNFHENMWQMFKKVSAREKVVGWYSTGPKIRFIDLKINELFRQYVSDPVYVIVDAQLKEVGIPTKAYVSVEDVLENGQTANRFQHIASLIGALEAEEVGVEHLLRDVKDTNISSLATRINDRISAFKSLIVRITEMHKYLQDVISGVLPTNYIIINQIQQLFNLIPDIEQECLLKAFNTDINDQMMVLYISSIVRSITTLHNLIENKASEEKNDEFKDAKTQDDTATLVKNKEISNKSTQNK